MRMIAVAPSHIRNTDQLGFKTLDGTPVDLTWGDFCRAARGGAKIALKWDQSPEMIDELVRDVLVKLTAHLGNGSEITGSLTGLIYSMAKNEAYDQLRKSARRRAAYHLEGEARDQALIKTADEAALTPEESLINGREHGAKRKALKAALQSLSERDRGALAGMLQRKGALPRTTELERRYANMITQSEKRARDRLKKAVARIIDERGN